MNRNTAHVRATRTRLLALAALLLAGCASYAGETQTLRFTSSDGTSLAGTLVWPQEGEWPVPGVVLLHGAEPATRSMAYRMQANVFVERGMAVLLFDKRGAGESEGDHDELTFELLIGDALAAVEWLRNHDRVQADNVGIMSSSQSGWFAPEVAERAGGLSFAINKVGPCSAWFDTVSFEAFNDFQADGIDEESARTQSELQRRIRAYQIAPDSTERVALERALAEWADRQDSRLPESLEPVSRSEREWIGYDPTPFLQRANTPMLYLYGSEDINIPTARCVGILDSLQAGGSPVSYYVFDGEGHEIGGLTWKGYAFADGFGDMIGDFAVRHTR